MAPESMFPDDPDDTRQEILKATHEALLEYGYADLTVDRIGQHFPKSKSLLYHHYDGKDDLIRDFLVYLLDTFEAGLGLDPSADAYTRLTQLLDRVFDPDGERADALRQVTVELRAQGVSDEEYREHFTEHDRFFRAQLAEIVEDGIEDGSFREVDPEGVARMIHTLVTGSMVGRVTTADEDVTAVRAELDEYIERRLLSRERDGQR
jgi:AcrR family transcriptional regulator